MPDATSEDVGHDQGDGERQVVVAEEALLEDEANAEREAISETRTSDCARRQAECSERRGQSLEAVGFP